MKNKYDYIKQSLAKRLEQNQYQQLRCIMPFDDPGSENETLNFTSGDYLGLSKHSYIKKKTIQYVLEWGAGSTHSRILTDHIECHQDVEQKLASLIGTETALLLPSGFQITHHLLPTLINARSQIFIDRFCSRNLFQGLGGAKVHRYEHSNIKDLEALLQKYENTPSSTKLIISESLFSQEGDTAPLKALIELAKKYRALLYIDDSQAVGVMGKHGMGLAACRKGIDLVVGTFNKAFGSYGAYVGCSKLMKDYLAHFCQQLSSLTALPPAVLGSINASLDLIPDMEAERKRILENSVYLRELLDKNHFSFGDSSSQIIPLYLETEKEALDLAEYLSEQKILTTPILEPNVPPGTSRIRLALTNQHTKDDLHRLIKSLCTWKEPAASLA